MDNEKKYKQLHTLISDLYPFMSEYCKEKVEGFFPELAGSKDERIRKALLEMVHDTTGDELWVDYNVHKEEALAWLEKQGEQKPFDYEHANIQQKDFAPKVEWKPSDEQMATLYKYAEQNNYDGSILTSLYNDLNKLKGK